MTARVKFVHNVAGGPAVDIGFDDTLILESVSYQIVSGYFRVESGKYSLTVYVAGTDKVVKSSDYNFLKGEDYTVIVHGNASNTSTIDMLVLRDNTSCPSPGKAHVRFVHAAAGAPSVDVYAQMSPLFKNVSYGETGVPTYLPVNASYYRLSVTPAGSQSIVAGPYGVNLEKGTVYTIIASGIPGNQMYPLDGLICQDNKCSIVNVFSN